MRIVSGEVVLSPSDLMRFQACAHATSLDLRLVRGEALEFVPDEPDALVLQARGEEHEQNYLETLQADRDVVVRAHARLHDRGSRVSSSTPSRRRRITNGRMTLPYSDCRKSPRRSSAIDHTKPKRVRTFDSLMFISALVRNPVYGIEIEWEGPRSPTGVDGLRG